MKKLTFLTTLTAHFGNRSALGPGRQDLRAGSGRPQALTRRGPASFVTALVLTLCTLAGSAPTGALAQSAASAEASTNSTTAEAPETTNTDQQAEPAEARGGRHKLLPPHGSRPGEMVVYGRDVEVKAGQTVDTVVVFGGSAKIHGTVREDVVVFGGQVDLDGEIGGDTVAFLGDINLNTNATIKGDTVAFLGGITLQTNATVHGDAVAFGGSVDTSPGGTVQGDVVPFSFWHGPATPKWLRGWLYECAFKLRPLALQVPWVWAVAGLFLLLYLFIAVVFPQPVRACVDELERRPATTFLFGLLTKLLVPLLFLILALTGVGLVVVPFLGVALLLGAVVGKVALLEWLGLRLGNQLGQPALQKPVVALLLGTALLTLFYLIWVVGLLVFLLFSVWGLGVAITAVFGGLRREMPAKTPPPSAGFREPPVMPTPAVAPAPTGPTAAYVGVPPGPAPAAAQAAGAPTASALLEPPRQIAVPELLAYPRAGFWERLGAGFLDIVLVGILTGLAHGPFSAFGRAFGGPSFSLLVAVAYFAGMWAWKGTTIGGIVLGLKVVRLDGQALSFAVCLVRALMAAFSVVVFFLGFLWIAWDPEKQGWHDRVAGTVVLRLPRGNPLICL